MTEVICNRIDECLYKGVCVHRQPHSHAYGCDNAIICYATKLKAICIPYTEKSAQVLRSEASDLHRQYNYDLCTAIDLIKLSIVLDKMVSNGHMDGNIAKLYKSQAQGILTLLREENNRAFDK